MWNATTARSKVSELLDRAETDGPQRIKRRGRMLVVLTATDYKRLTCCRLEDSPERPKPMMSLGEFLLRVPSFEGVDLGRERCPPRKLDGD